MSKFSAVVEAWALLWACRVALWVAPFPRVLRGAEFCAARRSRRPMDPLRALSAIHFALPLTVRASCLTQALAGWVMLTRHGVAGRVRIGVSSHEKHGFKAHAWMEVGGVVLLGDDVGGDEGLEAYQVIWTLPAE